MPRAGSKFTNLPEKKEGWAATDMSDSRKFTDPGTATLYVTSIFLDDREQLRQQAMALSIKRAGT